MERPRLNIEGFAGPLSSLARRRAALALIGVLNCTAVLSCREIVDEPNPAVVRRVTSVDENLIKTPSTISQRLANLLPEYGGAFVDKQGVLNVYLTDLGRSGTARAVIASEFARVRRPARSMRFRLAQFSYRQLYSFRQFLLPSLGAGVAYWGVDDRTNRYLIGVVSETAKETLLTAIVRARLPVNAFTFEAAHYATPLATKYLDSLVRPVVGGVQVSVNGPHPAAGTLGAVVKISGTKYLLISSHVADYTGNGHVGDTVFQAWINGSERAGQVVFNPAFASGSDCPSGRRCRLSDAALASIDPGISTSFGSIARPTDGPISGGDSSGKAFDTSNPIVLTDESLNCQYAFGCNPDEFPGETASKVGRATGWTTGEIIRSGIDVVGGDGFVRRTVVWVAGGANNGDSGAPVIAASENRLAGIVWAADTLSGVPAFLYSPIFEVSQDLSGAAHQMQSAQAKMLGYEARWIHPVGCYNSPDAQNMYLIYGWPDAIYPYSYESETSILMGETAYLCDDGYHTGNYQQSLAFFACTDNFGGDCPCAAITAGASQCDVREP